MKKRREREEEHGGCRSLGRKRGKEKVREREKPRTPGLYSNANLASLELLQLNFPPSEMLRGLVQLHGHLYFSRRELKWLIFSFHF